MNTKNLISFSSALQAVLKSTKPGPVKEIKIGDATGFLLYSAIKSPVNSPPFHNSAMDGYAFRYKDFINGRRMEIVGVSAAGNSYNSELYPNQTIRIFTGAEIPKGADTVVMQEKVRIENNCLIIEDNLIKKGSNIRLAGSQIKRNNIALKKNHYITAGSIGFLASLGIDIVKVYTKPIVTIIVTGNELVAAGRPLAPGKIYESNAQTLRSALQQEGIQKIFIKHSVDKYSSTLNAFRKACTYSDVVLFTGGISVGDYDYVSEVLKNEKVVKIFHGVKQKPGKPLYFGVKDRKLIFGLPGNPASVLTCFYEYVLPALRKFQSNPRLTLQVMELPLTKPVKKKSGLTVFMKAFTDFKSVTVLEGQESYIMKSFADANCFVVLDEETTECAAGKNVEVHLFGNL